WASGQRYEGQFKDGIRCGWGKLRSPDGQTKEGIWLDEECTPGARPLLSTKSNTTSTSPESLPSAINYGTSKTSKSCILL
ncbi:unnamed protein product, partial [Adineta ricciae]